MFGLTMLLFILVMFPLLITSYINRTQMRTFLDPEHIVKDNPGYSAFILRRFPNQSGLIMLYDYDVDLEYEETRERNYTVDFREGEPFSTMVYPCLLTPNGIEYEGIRRKTKSRKTCINWNNPLLTQEMNIKPFKSKDFPDMSIENASHFCRNPDNSSVPWCFRKDNMKREDCDILYCTLTDCILTGPGLEYKGTVNTSAYGSCELWTIDVPNEDITPVKPSMVPNVCRNPTFDLAGPYCYVHEPTLDHGTLPGLRKSYCDIPLCDIYYDMPSSKGELYFRRRGPYLFCVEGRDVDYYTHYTLLNSERNSLNVSLKLWNPATAHNDQVRIVLSVLAIPANSTELSRWDIGFEIVLSNNKTGILSPPEDTVYFQIPGFLSGIRWTHLILDWDEQGINLNMTQEEESTSIFHFWKPNIPNTIRGLYQNKLQYFSVLGSTAFMRIVIPDGGECEEHITTEEIYARYFPFFRSGPVRRLRFYLRSKLPCLILMRVSPLNNSYPEVELYLDGRSTSQLRLRTYHIDEAGKKFPKEIILQESDTFNDIKFLNWTYFSLGIRDFNLWMTMRSPLGKRYLFDQKNIHFNTLKYYSIASVSVAHWTFGCPPDEVKVKKFLPPNQNRRECSTTINDIDYMGQISVSEKGRSCLPWISVFPTAVERMYVSNNTYEAVNYCRNILERDSAYCYVYDRLATRRVKRDYCLIPVCHARECRMYGTGAGNMLNESTTISGRKCKYWKNADGKFKAMFPKLDEKASRLRKKLLDINLSENFCRNPTNDISGPWCSTTDPTVEYDSCNVPDCDKPFETIILLTTNVKHETYVKPLWRVTGWKFWLKRWERNIDAGFKLTLSSANRTEYFEIIFEGKNNSHVLLMYGEKKEKPREVERYLPFLFYLFIPNNWSGYHLTLRPDRLILGVVGEKLAFLNWNYSHMFDTVLGKGPSHKFTPMFLTYEKTYGGVLAMSFDPEDAIVEILTYEDQDTYYPITYNRMPGMAYLPANVVLFYFRGEGDAEITFYNTISMGPEMIIELGTGFSNDTFVCKMYVQGEEKIVGENRTNGSSIVKNKWTEFRIIMIDEIVTVLNDDNQLSLWESPRPFLPYYFKLQTTGNITWMTNSNPPDMDSRPIDGGWSEWLAWDCSASCGGGRGVRYRLCSSPEPSIFGQPCYGEQMEQGVCNEFTCDDLPPDIMEAITYRLHKYVYNQAVFVTNESVHIECYADILEIIQEYYPVVSVYWDKNGDRISPFTPITDIDPQRFYYYKKEAELSDTGVYSCAVRGSPIRWRPLKIVSLIVKTESADTFVGFRGETFSLCSNNVVFSALFKHLDQMWLHDNIPSFLYMENHIALVNTLNIKLELNHTGVWECIIRNTEFKHRWHTNWLKIKVKDRNDFVKYLMEDNDYTKHIFKNFAPIYVEISFAILVILVVIVSIGLAILLVIIQRYLMEQWNKLYTAFQDKMQAIYATPDEEIETSENSVISRRNLSYIKGDREHTIYYASDEYESDSDPHNPLGIYIFREKKKRRKIERGIATGRKRRRLIRGDFKKGKTHKMTNVRRSTTDVLNISYKQSEIRRVAEERIFKSLASSSSSSTLIVPYLRSVLGYQEFTKNKAANTEPTETPTLDLSEESHSRIVEDADDPGLIISEEQESMSCESEEKKSTDLKETFTPSTFVKYYGRSQLYRPDPVPYKPLVVYDSSSDSTYSDPDSDSIVLVSNDLSSYDSENNLKKILERKYWTD